MNEKFNAILSISIIPRVVELIADRLGLPEEEALTNFYKSEVYENLSKENTKLWHYSALTLFNMYKSEIENGVIAYPEGA